MTWRLAALLVLWVVAARAEEGEVIFRQRCAVCHGQAVAGKVGPDIRCHRDIRETVKAGRPATPIAMPAFPDLTDAEIAGLQAWLWSTCPRVDGATLYRTHCARCHGSDAAGGKTAPPAACATRVADALARGRDEAMPAFPGIEPPFVAKLQKFLDERCAARRRPLATVYAANCGTCHGATGAGGKNARGVEGPDIRCTARADFLDAVERGWGGMPQFPALSRATVTALFAHVHGKRCPPSDR